MLKLEGLNAFIAVVEAGTFSEAARRLRISKSMVSQRVADLERSLGARLVQRTTRKLALTEDGVLFHRRALRIAADLTEATTELSERRGALVGPLRLSAPVSFGILHLAPALYPFLRENPGLELTLDLDDRFVDAATGGYDAVIRHGALRPSGLVAKRLARSSRVLVASPEYLARAGRPHDLRSLETHRAIVFTHRGGADWRFVGSRAVSVRGIPALAVNSGLVMRDAAIAGLGISLLPTFLVTDAVADGRLEVVDVGLEPEPATLALAYPRDRRPPAKVVALERTLRRAFGNPPYWDLPRRRA
jgi:DNA-binding transcriptional LysR family regulator